MEGALLWARKGSQAEGVMHVTGLTPSQAEEVNLALLSIPIVTATSVSCQVDGEDGEIMEQDIVTCSARLILSRASHVLTGPLPTPGTCFRMFRVHSAGHKRSLLCPPDASSVL